jgi:hypothetical protein
MNPAFSRTDILSVLFSFPTSNLDRQECLSYLEAIAIFNRYDK